MLSLLKDIQSIGKLLTQRERWKLALLFGLMLVAAVLEAIGIGAVPVFITFLMQPSKLSEYEPVGSLLPVLPDVPSMGHVVWASVLLLAFVLFKSLFLAGVYYIQSRIVSMQMARLSNRMFRAYQKAPYDWLLQRSTSDLIRNIQNDTMQVIMGVFMPVLEIVLAVALSISVVAVMILATPGSTLISMGIVGVGLFALIHLMRSQMLRIGIIQRTETQRSLQSIQQGFGAIVDARIIGCEDYLASVHRGSVMRSARAGAQRNVFIKSTPLAIEAIAVFGLLTVLYFIINSGESIQSSLPTLAVIGVALIRLKQMASKLAASANQINNARPYIPGLLRDIAELKELDCKQAELNSRERLISEFDSLKLEQVSYAYPNSEKPAVKGISLELEKGESVAFVGSTGCGKSTLVNIILGLLQPQEGQVLVNGMDIRKDPQGWRECLGYIPQSIFLLDDTIRANIAFGVAEEAVDEDQVMRSLECAAMDEFVQSLPDGLDTVIGERGVRLSGGQRQRLGIARTLYFDPQVLVMDEGTSALDNRTEIKVMQAIQNLKKNRALIMIAHRLSTVEESDRLYFLHCGCVQCFGSYKHLFRSSSLFRNMVEGSESVEVDDILSL